MKLDEFKIQDFCFLNPIDNWDYIDINAGDSVRWYRIYYQIRFENETKWLAMDFIVIDDFDHYKDIDPLICLSGTLSNSSDEDVFYGNKSNSIGTAFCLNVYIKTLLTLQELAHKYIGRKETEIDMTITLSKLENEDD